MLETLVSIVNFVRTSLYYALYISYKTGSFIVSSINALAHYFSILFHNFSTVFSVFGESFVIFLQDNLQFVQQASFIITSIVETITSSVATVFFKITSFVYSVGTIVVAIYNAVTNAIVAIFTNIGNIFVLCKKLIILFGSGIWFLVTLVPFLLYYFCTLCISFVRSIYEEICDILYRGVINVKTLLGDTVMFILDVPIESLAGILIALSLAYIFSQFYVLILSYLKQQLRKVRIWIRRRQFRIHNVFSLQRQASEQDIIARRPTVHRQHRNQGMQPTVQAVHRQAREQVIRSRMPVKSQEEKFCVICQERNKCVLLLPCRHLCLCSECMGELRYYNEVCPICRTGIESSMKIFL